MNGVNPIVWIIIGAIGGLLVFAFGKLIVFLMGIVAILVVLHAVLDVAANSDQENQQ